MKLFTLKLNTQQPFLPVITVVFDLDSDASALPFTWTQTGQDTLVSLIRLQPSDFEYQQVEQNFRTTLGNTAATIMSVGTFVLDIFCV